MNPLIHTKLLMALTNYDRRQSRKRGYNHYALAAYMGALQYTEDAMEQGHTLRQALVQNYNDRLLDACLKAVGEPKATLEELR